MTPTAIAAYLALFFGVAIVFVLVNLLVGKLVRPQLPNTEKLEIYECGEPTIGSSFVQFDLRFYVVALLFLIFDVEVAFFFPWANVFGKASALRVDAPADAGLMSESAGRARVAWEGTTQGVLAELGFDGAHAGNLDAAPELGRQLAMLATADILVFFAFVMVGFFYVWKRGDVDWVRSMSASQTQQPSAASLQLEAASNREASLSGASLLSGKA